MNTGNLEKEYHVSRYIIVYKFLLGLFETILGLGMLLFGSKISELYINFTNRELLEEPHELLALILQRIVPFILEHQGTIILILLLLGITKIAGAIGLWYRKHWGLDILMFVTIILLPFELFSLNVHPSLSKITFFIINMLIALYLVNFNPKGYFTKLKKRWYTPDHGKK